MENYKNQEWLEKAFKENGNLQQIGKMCNVSGDTIEYWRKKFNISKSDLGKQVNRKNKLNDSYFEVIDDEHKAYWLGFIMADGCITRTEKNGPYNRFEFNLKEDDIELLNLFQKDLESNYQIKIKQNVNKKRDICTTICNIRISSRKLVNSLIANEITPNKTGKEVLPKTIPEQYIKDFIRGYFDGDGSLTINKSFRICSSSIDILNSINKYLKNTLNITFNVYEDKSYKIPFFTIDSNNRKNNKIVLDHLYNNATIYLNRKYERYLDMYCSPIQ